MQADKTLIEWQNGGLTKVGDEPLAPDGACSPNSTLHGALAGKPAPAMCKQGHSREQQSAPKQLWVSSLQLTPQLAAA